jgi:hypothetical protein
MLCCLSICNCLVVIAQMVDLDKKVGTPQKNKVHNYGFLPVKTMILRS